MHPLLIVLVAWLVLSIPTSLIFGAMVGDADRLCSPTLRRGRAEREDRVEVHPGDRDDLSINAGDADIHGRKPNHVIQVSATTAA